jgi:L-fuculose-phosphate aldolase
VNLLFVLAMTFGDLQGITNPTFIVEVSGTMRPSSGEEMARYEVIRVGQMMLQGGYVTGTWGNVSCRFGDKMLISPSGMDYGTLTVDDICAVGLRNGECASKRKPSIETPLHRAVYNERPDVNWVIHNHSRLAGTVAAARKTIPPILDDMVQLVGGPVRVAEYGLPGSDDLVENCLTALGQFNAVLLANHGVVCVGKDSVNTFRTCEVVEKAALAFLLGQLIGGPVPIPDELVDAMHDFFMNRYGQR